MDDLLRELVGARDGHFLLESGHHGPLWLELDSLFLDPERFSPLVDDLAGRLGSFAGDVVCGPLVGGALLAQQLASRLGTFFVYSERASDRANGLFPACYEVPAALRPVLRGARVLVVDDVVNAGSATGSTIAAVRSHGGHPVVVAALLRLGDGAVALAAREEVDVVTPAVWPGTLWDPDDCPRCAAGVPLQRVHP